MLIFHPSNKKFDIIKVKYFGENLYTQNDKKTSPILRSFWYTVVPILEDRLKEAQYIYVVNVKRNQIYDLIKDELNFKKKFTTIHKLLLFLKTSYLGVKYKVDNYELVAIFKDIKPIARLKNKENI